MDCLRTSQPVELLPSGARIAAGEHRVGAVVRGEELCLRVEVEHRLAKLNGKRYTKSYILYDDIRKGGVLELQMGNKPSAWGTKSADRP